MPPETTSAAPPATLLRNSTWLLLARLYGVAASGAVSILAVRTMSVAEYGHFALALAVVALVGSLSELGIATLATRRIVQEPQHAARTLGVALSAELLTSLIALVVAVPIVLALGYPSAVLSVLAIGAILVFTQGALAALEAPFQAQRTFVWVSVCGAAQNTVLLAVGIPVLLAGGGPTGLISAMAAAALTSSGLAAVLLRRRLALRLGIVRSLRDVREFLRSAWPIAATGAVTTLYDRVDVVLLSKLGTAAQVGFYSVPLTILYNTYVIPGVVSSAFFPLLSAQLQESRRVARTAFGLMVRLFVLGGGALALILGAGAADLLPWVFGSRYGASVGAMEILSPLVLLSFLNYLLWYTLLAGHQERGKALAMLVGLALNVTLNVILIPRNGVEGAATALLVTDSLVVIAQVAMVHRSMFALDYADILGKPLLAGAVVAALIVAGPVQPGIGLAAVTVVAWLAVLLATRYVRPAEWQPLTGPAKAILGRLRTGAARSAG